MRRSDPRVCSTFPPGRQHVLVDSRKRKPILDGCSLAKWLLTILFSIGVAAAPTIAQDGRLVDEVPVVASLRITGNTYFSKEDLRVHIRTAPNRRMFGIPGLTPWRWIHQLGEAGCCFGEAGRRALLQGGEPPAFLDRAVLEADVERLRLFYLQEGFRRSQVTAHVDSAGRGNRVAVRFEIDAGPPSFLRRIQYEGIEDLTRDQKIRLARESPLRGPRVNEESPLTFTARRERYSEPRLLDERRRILAFLRNEGYASVARDSVRAIVTPVSADSFDITFQIRAGERYKFGDILFTVVGPEAATTRIDTLHRTSGPAPEGEPLGYVVSRIESERRLKPAFLLHALRVEPGDWYDQSQLLATKRRLEAAGIFSYSDFVPLWEDPDVYATNAPRLPHLIELRTRRRHQLRMETFLLQRTGVLGSGSGTEIGSGIGGSYYNVNAFGHGETFQLRTAGSIATDVERRGLLSTLQGEVSASIIYPYLFRPFGWLDNYLDLYEARSRVSISFITARRHELIIRGRMSTQVRLELRHSPTLTSELDVLDFILSDPDTTAGFDRNFLSRIDDPVERERILEDFSRPQVNNALRYTLRSSTVNPLTRERGYSYEGIAEIGGNLPYLLDRFVFSPGDVEGSLPGLPFFKGEGEGSRLVYRQYVRGVVDLRHYAELSRSTVLAGKVMAGVAHPLGGSEVVPFDRRFYIGGASSVRGWALHQLGPGAVPPTTELIIRGGDIKLEASAELRRRLVRRFLTADWIGAVFLDAGNVWFGPRNPGSEAGHFRAHNFYQQIAVGSGVGLRVAWDYLIIRFDLAHRLHNPQVEDRFLPDGFRKPRLHFGIGHAF